MKVLAALLVALMAIKLLSLAEVKVKNELQMTKEYARQAAALERIAIAAEKR